MPGRPAASLLTWCRHCLHTPPCTPLPPHPSLHTLGQPVLCSCAWPQVRGPWWSVSGPQLPASFLKWAGNAASQERAVGSRSQCPVCSKGKGVGGEGVRANPRKRLINAGVLNPPVESTSCSVSSCSLP